MRTLEPVMIMSDLKVFGFRKLDRIQDLISAKQLVRVELSYSGEGSSGYVISSGSGDHGNG